jgi:ATP-dependent DNA ligase I
VSLFIQLAETSQAVAAQSSRLGKIDRLAGCLGSLQHSEVPIAIHYLSGSLPQGRIGMGWSSLQNPPAAAAEPTLSVHEVDRTFANLSEIAGSGSVSRRGEVLRGLLSQATDLEQQFIVRLLTGEIRQGALKGVMTDAVARASGANLENVRRRAMLEGGLAQAWIQLKTGQTTSATATTGITLFQPIQPMLAQSAPSITEAMERLSTAAVQWKLDGIRIQVHKNGTDVRIYSRSLAPITSRLPEIVAQVSRLPISQVVLDGEAFSIGTDGRPRPFQETGSRISTLAQDEVRTRLPLQAFFFDVLHLEGEDLLDQPLSARLGRPSVISAGLWVPQIVTDDPTEAEKFYMDCLSKGHEGVVLKGIDSTYGAGRRGGAWIKVKPHHTLDLVVLAAEWGHGRRQGWLSNLHLGARDPSTGTFVMLGKTFKGLTDQMLTWQTSRLKDLEVGSDKWTVYVRPELVVEIAFDGIQTSSRYPAGMALRFARVIRYRDDKAASEADSVETVRSLHRQ